MSWQDRFRKIRKMADEKQRWEADLIKRDRKSSGDLVNERRKQVKVLEAPIKKVAKQFNRAVKGQMKVHRPDYRGKGNIAWRLQMKLGGIEVATWPWLLEMAKPRLLGGIWIQYLGPDGEELVSESRVRGTKLGHYYELGREGALASGYYYWIQTDFHTGPSVFGYFLSLKDFTEERLASILEEIGYDLVKRFTRSDFYHIGRISSRF